MSAFKAITDLEVFLNDRTALEWALSDDIFELEEMVLKHTPRTATEAASILALSMNNLLADEDPRLQELAASAQRSVIEYLGGVQGPGLAEYYGVIARVGPVVRVGG